MKHVWHRHKEALLVAALYIASQLAYTYALGLRFSNLMWFWQYLGEEWLRDDLLRSLFYQHSQPPLMNLLLGLILKTVPQQLHLVFGWGYFGIGLAAVLFLHAALQELGVRRAIRIAMIAWLCLFPTFALYAKWGYTTHLEFSLCCAALYYLARLWREGAPSTAILLGIFIPCCLLGLTRPHWHLLVFVGLGAALWLFYRRAWTAKHSFTIAAALSPVLLVYLKNLVLYGFLGATSWMGSNIADVAYVLPLPGELWQLKDQRVVSHWFPIGLRLEVATNVRKSWVAAGKASPDYGHPSLGILKYKEGYDRHNYNYQAMVESGKQDLEDSLAIIRRYPWKYAEKVLDQMALSAVTPSLSHRCCGFGLENVRALDVTYDQLPPAAQAGMGVGSAALYAAAPLLALALAAFGRGYVRERRAFVVTVFFVAATMLLISCAFNWREHERARWGTAPLYLALLALAGEAAARQWPQNIRIFSRKNL